MNRRNRNYSRIRDLYLAAYLFVCGGIIVGIEADEQKVVFAFVDSLEIQDRKDDYISGKAVVNTGKYVTAIKTLKSKAIDVLIKSHDR